MTDLLRPGGAPHRCDWPRLDLEIRDGAVWRCGCGARWRLDVTAYSEHSRKGEWKRLRWWQPPWN